MSRIALLLACCLLAAVLFAGPDPAVRATSGAADGPTRAPDRLFAASCATCHRANGLGGATSWVDRNAVTPRIARGLPARNAMLEARFRDVIRNGRYHGGFGFVQAMPAFGREVLSEAEVDALVLWLLYAPPLGGSDPITGVNPPPRPAGREIVLEILDKSPWFSDDGTDVRDPFKDRRRVVLSPGEYIKVVNKGRTWHTLSNLVEGVDTGFIGYAGNIPGENTGYYYLEIPDLADDAAKYYCSLHPYMQVEIVAPGYTPTPTTRVSMLPIGPPKQPGIGQVWVPLQTYANGPGEPDGALQVFEASDWSSRFVSNVGNNPHNGWIGTSMEPGVGLRRVAMFTNWHDVTATIVDAATLEVLGSVGVGAANAHVMTSPKPNPANGSDRWFVTVMGSNKVQEVDPLGSLAAGMSYLPAFGPGEGAFARPGFSPHGLWFLDDGDHFFTANTLAGSASLYSVSTPWADGHGRTGVGCEVAQVPTGGVAPLAASIFNVGTGGASIYRGFTNNAGTHDISLYQIDATAGAESLQRLSAPEGLANTAGNLALTNLSANPVRWARMPIQAAVSPPDATRHGRFLVVCNKASLNVSVVSLNPEGSPTGIYTFPAGLGAHGVAFGRKRVPGKAQVAYYAYVTCTFQDTVAVYDLERLQTLIELERLGQEPAAFKPGGATEIVRVDGWAANKLVGCAFDALLDVPITVFSPDARGLVHVGDLPLNRSPQSASAYLKEHVWIGLPGYGMTELDLDLSTSTGAMGVFCSPLPPPWGR